MSFTVTVKFHKRSKEKKLKEKEFVWVSGILQANAIEGKQVIFEKIGSFNSSGKYDINSCLRDFWHHLEL